MVSDRSFRLAYNLSIFLYITLASIQNVTSQINEPIDDNHYSSSFLFEDSTLYKIKWAGALQLSNQINDGSQIPNPQNDGEEIFVSTEKQEMYRCVIPNLNKIESGSDSSKVSDVNPYKLLQPLFTKKPCSYRIENYWTYEICHGKYIRQFHEDSGSKARAVEEYYLGTFDMEKFDQHKGQYEKKGKGDKWPVVNVEDLHLPYLEITMADGTMCDLANKKRITRVLYVCVEVDKHELFSIKETSTCEYEMIVFSPLLCVSSIFKLKSAVEHEINCYSMILSPKVPTGFQLENIKNGTDLLKNHINKNFPDKLFEGKSVMIDLSKFTKDILHDSIKVSKDEDNAKPYTDPSLLKKFISGEHCLTGGSGWWKYEFCYDKKVNQFHEEKGQRKTVINLGNWDAKTHMRWVLKNNKLLKSNKTPKQVSHFYSNGDPCDITNKPRTVEVKLKCLNVKSHPESISLYLLEPNPCEYILGVESPIICDLVNYVNEFGLFNYP